MTFSQQQTPLTSKTHFSVLLFIKIFIFSDKVVTAATTKSSIDSLYLHFNREGNHPDDYSRLTYKKLLEEVCRFANVLKSRGVKKGDRVAVYMPMILETVVVVLACSRIGAVHSLVVSREQKFTLFSNSKRINLSWCGF